MCWHKAFDGAEGLLIFSPTGGAVRRSIARRLDCSLLGSCRHGLHRDHQVLIGRIRPHHIRLRGVGLCSPWIALDHALGADLTTARAVEYYSPLPRALQRTP